MPKHWLCWGQRRAERLSRARLGMVYLINGNSAKYKKQPKVLLKSGQC